MKTKRNTLIHLILFFLPLFFGACKNQISENQVHSFEWEIESPENSGIDKNVLSALVDNIKDSTLYGVDALLFIKTGKIVFEEYFNGFTADSLHNVASVGKSITSALTGIAIEKGYIANKNEPVVSYFEQNYAIEHLSPEKKRIQVHHLLTMTAGWACDDWDESSPGNTMHFPALPDDFAFTLNLPMKEPNGEVFSYCSGGAKSFRRNNSKTVSIEFKRFCR
jgi:CubicO group peptidase (beta-lactamase class C family)